MDKKKLMSLAVMALAVYGGYKLYQNVKAKGGVAPALGLKS